MRACGGQGVKFDFPFGAPRSPTSNLFCRGSRGGRHRCFEIRDRAAAIMVAVAETGWSPSRSLDEIIGDVADDLRRSAGERSAAT